MSAKANMARIMKTTEDSKPRFEFSPRDKSKITLAFYHDVKASDRKEAHYEGTKLGYKFKLDWNALAVENPILWHVCLYRRWVSGNATDVYHALDAIGYKINNKELDRRCEQMVD